MRQERPVRHDVAPVNAERNENNVKRKSNKTATCGITECKQAQSHSRHRNRQRTYDLWTAV